MGGVVVWDFDGTLGYRRVRDDPGSLGLWDQCTLEVLDDHVPGHGCTLERLRPAPRDVECCPPGNPTRVRGLGHSRKSSTSAILVGKLPNIAWWWAGAVTLR